MPRKRQRVLETFNVDSEKILRTLAPEPTKVDPAEELQKAIDIPDLHKPAPVAFPELDLDMKHLFDQEQIIANVGTNLEPSTIPGFHVEEELVAVRVHTDHN